MAIWDALIGEMMGITHVTTHSFHQGFLGVFRRFSLANKNANVKSTMTGESIWWIYTYIYIVK